MPFYYSLMNLLGSHDRVRILNAMCGLNREGAAQMDRAEAKKITLGKRELKSAKKRYLEAMKLLCALPGAPTVYYGDEIGMQGYKDPFNRAFFDWESRETRIRPVLQNLAALRKSCPAFADGTLAVTQAQGGVLCYERRAEAAVAAVCINRTEQQVRTVLLGRTVEVQPCSFAVVTDPE